MKFKSVSEEGGVQKITCLIEIMKGRKEAIFVAFLDMKKACERMNRKKLFEVMRS